MQVGGGSALRNNQRIQASSPEPQPWTPALEGWGSEKTCEFLVGWGIITATVHALALKRGGGYTYMYTWLLALQQHGSSASEIADIYNEACSSIWLATEHNTITNVL